MDKQHENHELSHLMSRILEVRYTDLEEEQSLCRELLEKTEKNDDAYGQAFAYTFLGDYCVAVNNVLSAGEYLLKALEYTKKVGECDEIVLRINCLLGVYYEHQANEQNSIQCYLNALMVAQRLKDTVSECLVLNNMGFSFRRRGSSDRALEYFRQAYDLHKTLPEEPFGPIFAGNLAEILLDMNKLDEALFYIKEIENVAEESRVKERCLELSWCLYYAKTGQDEKCIEWAEKILSNVDKLNEEKMSAFENYSLLLKCMIDLGHEVYARQFLKLLEITAENGGVDQMRLVESRRIAFILRFEPEEKHYAAYQNFYQKMQGYKDQINETISSAMKGKIELDRVRRTKDMLQSEQENLQYQYERDELTGLYNRRFLDNLIRSVAHKEEGRAFSVVMLDVDYFKEYNDYYTHILGDEVLRSVASCLDSYKVDGLYPCRFGGDEFTCICDGLNVEAITNYVSSIRQMLHSKNLLHEKSPCSDRVTLSIGVAAGNSSADPYFVLQLADHALYESKQKGRNIVTYEWAGAYE